MQLILLTHDREIARPTNTGKLVQQVLGEQALTLQWARRQPDPQLLNVIDRGDAALIFPTDDAHGLSAASACFSAYILIDATWQEARKIYSHSPCLHSLPTFRLAPTSPSRYQARRNQQANGLCTVECAIELLRLTGAEDVATQLDARWALSIDQQHQ